MVPIPNYLISIRDQVIAHVLCGTEKPKNLDQLIEWIEEEYLYELSETWRDERFVLDLQSLASYLFFDSELMAYLETKDQITNELRVLYARKRIVNAFEDLDGSLCPSVHTVRIENDEKSSVVLGWLIEVHGQGGPAPKYIGAYLDDSSFYQALRACNYLLNGEAEKVADEEILKLWRKSSFSNQPIVCSILWNDTSLTCNMSCRTWGRILNGKIVRRVVRFTQDGKKYKTQWVFNSSQLGSLVIYSEDSEVQCTTSLNKIKISENDVDILWEDELKAS